MKNSPFLLISLSLLLACNSPTDSGFETFITKNQEPIDLWIKNGKILDGLGNPEKLVDILIQGDQIVFIGQVDEERLSIQKRIDAAGQMVAPGFIDAHAHGNPLEAPNFQNFLAMGVTTICLGQDGSSPNTENLGTWMQAVKDTLPGVNIAMFVGHGTLRRVSGVGYDSVPSPEGMSKMEALLKNAFQAGVFGMSTGLEYVPGAYAQKEEMEALARIVGENDGLIMSHIRNEDDEAIESSLNELLQQGQFCNVHAAHLKVVYGKGPERADQVLKTLFSQELPYRVTADLYPYMASYTGISIVFPSWAKPPNNYAEVKTEQREELLAFLRNKIIQRNGPEATLFGTTRYAGLTLAELSKRMETPYEEILLEIGPGGASGAYFIMNEPLQEKLITHPKVMLSSDGSPSMRHPRGYGSFAKMIEEFVREDELFDLPEAIRKMTSLTAETIGIKDRGSIQVGKKADLVLFDPAEVKANASYQEPHQLATGFNYVILNGQIALENGAFNPKRNGMVLRKE